MAPSAKDRQTAIDVMTQLMTASGLDPEDAETLVPEIIDEAIRRGDS
jgi:hypothetical protein